jgi:hypothetical protein
MISMVGPKVTIIGMPANGAWSRRIGPAACSR